MFKAIKSWWQRRHIRAKQKAAAATGTRYYGAGMTIHTTGHVDVETRDGEVVAVWFRCCPLPFEQSEASESRAADMRRMRGEIKHTLVGVETKVES